MIVTVTSIQLRSVWGFFRLSLFGLKIMGQLKTEQGYVKMLKTGSGKLHYTLTVWQSEADMKRFARTGEHLAAMKAGKALASETRSYSYETDTIPAWPEAKRLLMEQGKVVSYDKPKA